MAFPVFTGGIRMAGEGPGGSGGLPDGGLMADLDLLGQFRSDGEGYLSGPKMMS
jgi:hypothetical protein